MTATARRPFRQVEIDLPQLAQNLALARDAAGAATVLVDVGANAWGHGVAVIVPALLEQGVAGFVVARLEEAEAVRALAPEAVVLTLQHAPDESFIHAAALHLSPCVRSFEQLERCIAAGVQQVVLVEDDGRGMPALAPLDIRTAAAHAHSHGVRVLSGFVVAGPELLGLSESPDDRTGEYGTVLRLWAPVSVTKRVPRGAGVSYGHTYRTSMDSTLALVTLGYADGLSRAAGNMVPVSAGGRQMTVVGRVAMDAFMVDLGGDDAGVTRGTEVTVLGAEERGEPTAFDHARALGMHSAEVTTRLTARPQRYAKRNPA